jgi:alpha-tubulin suppressor-like RCC1 family protein
MPLSLLEDIYLDNLSDVTITTPLDNQVVTYDSNISAWVNKTVPQVDIIPKATQTELDTNNEIIFAECNQFGYPSYVNYIPSSGALTIKSLKIRSQNIVFTTPEVITNVNSIPLNTIKKDIIWVYADYNSNNPVIGYSFSEPLVDFGERAYESTIGLYYNCASDGDPFGGCGFLSDTTVDISTRYNTTFTKINSKSLQLLAEERIRFNVPSSSKLCLNNTFCTISRLPIWTIDFWMYPTSITGTTSILWYGGNSSGVGLSVRCINGSVFISMTSTGASYDILADTNVGPLVINSWNYIGVSYNGFKYEININSSIRVVNSSIAFSHNFNETAYSFGGLPGYYSDFYIRPDASSWRFLETTPPNLSNRVSRYPSFASYFNHTILSSMRDSYDFPWYLNTGTLTEGVNTNNGLSSILLTSNQFLYTPSFPQLNNLDAWTIEFWVRVANTTTNVFSYTPGILYGGVIIETRSTGFATYIGNSNASSWNVIETTTTVTHLNTWVHIAIVYSNLIGYRVFYNGILGPQSTNKDPMISSSQVLFGKSYFNNSVSSMEITEFHLSHRALYNVNFTPSTVPIVPNTSRDIFDYNSGMMKRQTYNGLVDVNRLYFGLINNERFSYTKSMQIISPLTNVAGNIIYRDGAKKNVITYDLPDDYNNGFYTNQYIRSDGRVVLASRPTELGSDIFLGANGNPGIPGYQMNYSLGFKVKSLTTGYYSTLVTDYSGNVWAYGYSTYGQLGPNVGNIRIPVIVFSGVNPSVYMFHNQNCNDQALVSSFIIDQGRMWATGYNTNGQLGVGDVVRKYQWTEVSRINSNNWKGVFCMGGNTWLWTDDSSGNLLYGCGYNNLGQLGVGSRSLVSTPIPCRLDNGTPITNVNKVVGTTTGFGDSMYNSILLNNGDVYTNVSSTTGHAGGMMTLHSDKSRYLYGPVMKNIKDVKASGGIPENVMLFLRKDGKLFKSGHNTFGNINIGSFLWGRPTAALENRFYPMNAITYITTNYDYTMSHSAAITLSGRVIFSGDANSVSNMYSLYGSDYDIEIYYGKSIEFPEPIDSIKLNLHSAGTLVRGSVILRTVTGKIYGCGFTPFFAPEYTVTTCHFIECKFPE